MSVRRAQLVADPLWSCLCPAWSTQSFDATLHCMTRRSTSNLRSSYFTTSRPAFNTRRRPASDLRSSHFTRRRPTFNTRRQPANTRSYNAITASKSRHKDQRSQPSAQLQAFSTACPHLSFGRYYETPFARPVETNSQLDMARVYGGKETATNVPSLYGELEKLSNEGNPDACRSLIQTLVKDYGEKPSIVMYNALILSNISADRGAAWRVHDLLKEMQDEGIELDALTCRSVLKVLSVHPDNLLRSDVMRYMEEKWLPLSGEEHHDITVGLLREGCFEMALAKLDNMIRQGIKAEPSLLDMFAFMLSDAGDMEAAYRIMRSRWDEGEDDIGPTLWHWLLDKASTARHYPMTEFIWRTQVDLDYFQASSGMCINIMSTASKAGDPALATEVVKYLGRRGERIKELHYQLLIDSYMTLEVPDVHKALSVLSIMPLEKLQPSAWQTRSLFMHLKDKPELTTEAFERLRQLHTDGRIIPIAVFNLIIECFVQQKDLESAMKVYKQLHSLRPAKMDTAKAFADTGIFNMLFKGCRVRPKGGDPRQAGFLLSEMLALRVPPDALTYDRLILVFTNAAVHAHVVAKTNAGVAELQISLQYADVAVQYVDECAQMGWRPRWATLQALAICLAEHGDTRCWDLLKIDDDIGSEEDAMEWSFRIAQITKAIKERLQSWDPANRTISRPYDEVDHEDEEATVATA